MAQRFADYGGASSDCGSTTPHPFNTILSALKEHADHKPASQRGTPKSPVRWSIKGRKRWRICEQYAISKKRRPTRTILEGKSSRLLFSHLNNPWSCKERTFGLCFRRKPLMWRGLNSHYLASNLKRLCVYSLQPVIVHANRTKFWHWSFW